MTPEEFRNALNEHVSDLIKARDFVQSLIDFAPEINNAAENQIKTLIRERVEAATDAISDLVLS